MNRVAPRLAGRRELRGAVRHETFIGRREQNKGIILGTRWVGVSRSLFFSRDGRASIGQITALVLIRGLLTNWFKIKSRFGGMGLSIGDPILFLTLCNRYTVKEVFRLLLEKRRPICGKVRKSQIVTAPVRPECRLAPGHRLQVWPETRYLLPPVFAAHLIR